MSEKKDTWEKLKNLPDEYERNPELAQRAIEKIQQEQAKKQPKENWFQKGWKYMAVSAATCAVALAVFIPVYHSLNKAQLEAPPEDSSPCSASTESSVSVEIPPVYYEANQVTVSDVADVVNFVQEQQLSVKYYDYQTAITQSAVIADSGEFAFLKQEMLYIGADGFDQVTCWGVVIQNAEFDFMLAFNSLNEEMVQSNITIAYKVISKETSSKKEIQAKFTYDSIDYYLDIQTSGEAVAKIEQYVNMLVN